MDGTMTDREPQTEAFGPWYVRRSFPDGKRWTIVHGELDEDIAAVLDDEVQARQIARIANRMLAEARADGARENAALREALLAIDALPVAHYRRNGCASPDPWVRQREVRRIARAALGGTDDR
jgi:hypothetical protein